MPQDGFKRKLAAILSADVKGYSLLISDDEVFTIETLKAFKLFMSNLISQHSGRVVDSPGDNLLAEFPSAVYAVECAVEVQKQLKKENARFVEDKRLEFRIGVNIGDVVQDGDRIFGDGVNVAARIERLADPGGISISRNAYNHVKGKLELGFEFLGEYEVKNIKEPVSIYKVLIDSELSMPLVDELLELPDKPSIAVLPFDNMSGDPSQEYFSDGMTENIITGLSKVKDLFVIARNSSFAYKGRSISIKQIARELGVKFIIEGSVQRAGDRVRITAQLIDATTDYHMWSENYDRELEDIFTLQDEITLKIIDAMQIKLTLGEQGKLWLGRSNIRAYEKYWRGMECFYRSNKRENTQARHLFMEGIDLDSQFDLLYATVGFTHMQDVMFGWSGDSINSLGQTEQFARKALALNDSLDLAHGLLGWVHLFRRQFEDAKKECERAVELNPNGSAVHAHLAFTLLFIGKIEEAIQLFKMALRLNPIPPPSLYNFLGWAYAHGSQYEKAIQICKESIKLEPESSSPYITLAFCYAMLNQPEEARKYASETLRREANFSSSNYINTFPLKDKTKAQTFIDGLCKAGLPE